MRFKREKVRVIPINLIDDFPDHPFPYYKLLCWLVSRVGAFLFLKTKFYFVFNPDTTCPG